MRRIVERAAQTGSDYVNAVLGTEWARSADRWLRDFVDAKSTAASRAMDAEYLRTHIGGGWHRIFDGGHDLWAASSGSMSRRQLAPIARGMGVVLLLENVRPAASRRW